MAPKSLTWEFFQLFSLLTGNYAKSKKVFTFKQPGYWVFTKKVNTQVFRYHFSQ